MKFTDKGWLDVICKGIGAIDTVVVGGVALAMLEWLECLYNVHWVVHQGKLLDHSIFTPFSRCDQE